MKKIVVNPKRVTASDAAQEYTTEEELLAAGYEALQINHKSAGKNYCLYRKMVNGKGDWYASDWNTRENVQHITYAQARGLEDINPTPVSRLGRELGKKLLPQTHVGSSITASEDDGEDLPQTEQEYDSAKTSINSKKLPAIYKMIHIPSGSVVIDYGGGRFDNAVDYMAAQDVTLYVYDPYNRSKEHNREAIREIRKSGGADYAICSNVLNVIKESSVRKEVLENIKRLLKPTGKLYLTVYEGKGDGAEGATKSGYQLNRPTANYLEEIQQVFPDATRKGKLITATPAGRPVESSTKPFKEGDKVKYMGKDTVVRKVEYDKQYGYDYLIDNPDWSEENYPNDADGKFKKIWVGSEVTAATEASGNLDVEAAMEYATGQIRHLCKQMGSRKVAEIDIDDIQLGPDNFSFDVILYNAQGNAWSKDTFATSIHPVDGKSQDMDDVQWVIDQKTDEFVYNMIHNPVKPTRPAFGSKSVKASSEVKRTFIVQQYMKEEDEYGPKFKNVHEADTHEAADEWLSKHLGDNELAPSEFRIIQCSTITPKNAGVASLVKTLIEDNVRKRMQTNFGFPADEAAEYSRVEVTQDDHSYFRVEVRAELSYDDMWEMKELLDEQVGDMDQDAYFDMDAPGIMSAYLNINKLKAHGKNLASITAAYRPGEIPEPPLEPPEPEYEDGDDYEDVLEIDVSAVVNFDEEGYTTYDTESWAVNSGRKDGDWVDDNGVYLIDSNGVIEEFDNLMKKSPNCPDQPGDYRVSGKLFLHFAVSGIYMDDDDYEQETYANYSEASATYDRSQSRIENLTFTEWAPVESATDGSANRQIRHEPLAHGYFLNEYTSGAISITRPRPYDDADYYWAHWDEPRKSWAICKSSMVVKYISEDDIDGPDDIAEELEMVNAGIEPKMMHN